MESAPAGMRFERFKGSKPGYTRYPIKYRVNNAPLRDLI